MSYRAIVFDLDGTLLNTLDDIADSANAVLADGGYPIHPVDAYRYFIGNGVATLFERALPEDDHQPSIIQGCVEGFRQVYEKHWDVKTHLYDGVAELLDELVKQDLRMAVLSNKPHTFTRKSVGRYLSRWPLSPVLGQRDGLPAQARSGGALEIADELGVAPTEFLYLGDTATDMETARAAGMFAVGALWGFRSEEELREAGAAALIARPLELLEWTG